MNCKKAQEHLMNYVDHPEQVPPDVREHLKECPDCREEVTFIKRMNRLMGGHQTSIDTPQSLRSRVRQTLHEELRETVGWITLLLAFLSGLGLAGVAVSALPGEPATNWLVTCSLWWGGLFVIGATLMVGGVRLANSRASGIATVSTVSAGGIFAGLYLCPGVQGMTGLAEFAGLQSVFHTLAGPNLSYLVIGLLFALVPTAVVTWFVARHIPDHWAMAPLLAGSGFLLLLAPLVYIECTLLPPLGAVLLVTGLLVGSLTGPLGGLVLRYYTPAFR